MCESFQQPNMLDPRVSTRVAQLRRLVWLLVVWSFFLTTGLAVSVFFQFNHPRAPSNKTASVSPLQAGAVQWNQMSHFGKIPALPQSSESTQVPEERSHPKILMYDFDEPVNTPVEGSIELRWKDNQKRDITIAVQEDGIYFLYLQVTLNSPKPNINYTVMVDKTVGKSTATILKRYINGSQLSTGFIGKGFHLSATTTLKVTCQPKPVNVNSDDTYLGIIKLS